MALSILLVAGLVYSSSALDYEASLWPSFQVLPKNSYGRLEPSVASEVLRRFFAREHGLQLKDEAATKATMSVDSGRGLSMKDVVEATTDVEAILWGDQTRAMQGAFAQHTFGKKELLSSSAIFGVLESYLYGLPVHSNDMMPKELLSAYKFQRGRKLARPSNSYSLQDALEIIRGVPEMLRAPSECDVLMRALELGVQAPTTPPERMLRVLVDIVPRGALMPEILERLKDVAGDHGGFLPLQGEALAEVLFLASPSECPEPASARLRASQSAKEKLALLPFERLTEEFKAFAHLHVSPALKEVGLEGLLDLNGLLDLDAEDFARLAAAVAIVVAMLRMAKAALNSSRGAVSGKTEDSKKPQKPVKSKPDLKLVKRQTQPDSQPDPQLETQPEAKPETQPETQPETKPEPLEAQPKTQCEKDE